MITNVQTVIVPSPGISQAIYYSSNIAGASSNSVTVTFDRPASFPQVGVTEFSNVSTTQSVDTTTTASGTGILASSSIQTVYATTLLVGYFSTTSIGEGTSAGWANLFYTGDVVTEYSVLSTAGSAALALDIYPSGSWIGQIVAFRTTGTPVPLEKAYASPGTVTQLATAVISTPQIAGSCNVVTIFWQDSSAGVETVTDLSGNIYHAALVVASTPAPVFEQSVFLNSDAQTGDLMVVTGTLPSTTIPNITVTDNLNTVYTQFGVTLTVFPGTAMWLFYGIANATSADTITVSYSTIQSGPTVTVMEWNSTGGWIGTTDGYAMRANPFGLDITTNPIVTTNSDDLFIVTILNAANASINVLGANGNSTMAPGAAWNSLVATWDSVQYKWDSVNYLVMPSLAWSTFVVSSDLTIAWEEVVLPGTYSFDATQTISGPWAAVIWSFQAALPVVSPPVTFNVTTSYLAGTAFKEVYPNRIPELIYDSLSNTPTFVYNQFGPSYGT